MIIFPVCVLLWSFPDNTSVDVKTAYYQNSLAFDINRRENSAESKLYNDCHYKERKLQRPVPTNCYGTEFQDNWISTKNWLYEVRADLMYTFDNVLWDDLLPNRKENQFWYLILYLKTLVTLHENPIDIVNVVSYRIADNINELCTRVRDLEQRLPLLSETTDLKQTVVKDKLAVTSFVTNYTQVVDKEFVSNGNILIKP